MSKIVNLTKVQGCYSKELREATYEIKLCLREPSVSLQDMKNYVEAVIEPASIDADAKKRFRKNLSECNTKQEVDQLCYDAVVHGMYYRRKES
jgi:hypothetical protein